MKTRLLILSLLCLLNTACANQYRDGDAGVSAEQVLSMLGEVANAPSASSAGGDLAGAVAMKDQEGVRIYFAQSKNERDSKRNIIDPMGPVASILSLTNLDFLGQIGVSRNMIDEARIFFLDLPSADGSRRTGLIIGTRKPGETTLSYAGFTGTGAFNDSEFTATFPGKVVLRSYDVDGGDLAGVIQMLVWDIDENGAEYYNGKFSTLIGFGG